MRALRAISTRATITPARLYNFYDWGGLKADPRELVRRYFDLFVYTGNGRPELGMLRVPADRVALRRWRPYVSVRRGTSVDACAASLAVTRGVAILTVTPAEQATLGAATREWRGEADVREDEGFESWPEEDSFDEASWPVPLALARGDLLARDLRPLYLLWLLAVQEGERRPTTVAPPRPPKLAPLSGTLCALAEFVRLDSDLLAVALEAPDDESMTAGDLLDGARGRGTGRRREAVARAAAERVRRLVNLEAQQETEWREIERLLEAEKVKPSVYDDIMRRLGALHELAVDRGRESAFRTRARALAERHARPTAFRQRLRRAGLDASGSSR